MDHIQFTLRLLAATGLGGLIGLERQLTGHASGMRTCALVCVGSSLVTAFSFCLPRRSLLFYHISAKRKQAGQIFLRSAQPVAGARRRRLAERYIFTAKRT